MNECSHFEDTLTTLLAMQVGGYSVQDISWPGLHTSSEGLYKKGIECGSRYPPQRGEVGEPTWEPYDFIGEPFLELGDTIRAGRHLLKAQLDFWERFLARSR